MDSRECGWRENLKRLSSPAIYDVIQDAQQRIGTYALSELENDDPYLAYQRSIVLWCMEELESRKEGRRQNEPRRTRESK